MVIDSGLINGMLKKGIPKDMVKKYSVKPENLDRKPKYLNTKLEEKIKSFGSMLKDIYYSIENDVHQLDNVECFDSIRINQYKVMIMKAKDIKDTAKRMSELSNVFNMIKQDMITSLGLKDVDEQALKKDEMLRLAYTYGQQYFE